MRLGFDWRKRGDSLRDIQIITCFKFHFILTLIFCHIVAFTPGLQTTVSSVVWSACFCCCIWHRLQADFQPVRIPFRRHQNKTNRQIFACSFCLAEARGFEPLSPWRLHDFQSCPLWPLRYASILRFYFKALPRLLSTAFLFYMFSL